MREFEVNTEFIKDDAVRDVFLTIRERLNSDLFGKFRGEYFEIDFDSAVTNFEYTHNLGFQPTDVMQTFVSNGATVTWNYDNFSKTHLDITTSAACKIRAFIGSYTEE